MALLGHICHSEGPARTRRLFQKVSKALKPKGMMVVADFIADERRQGKDRGGTALLFALNMLAQTREGATFTFGEYRNWAKEAGFRRSELIEVPGPSPVMLFQK